MNPIRKAISTWDGRGLRSFSPEVADNFFLLIHLTIGPDDLEGGIDYTLSVCTPRWIQYAVQREGFVWDRHLLVVDEFDEQLLTKEIDDRISQCKRESPAETVEALARYFFSEFEDYQPEPLA